MFVNPTIEISKYGKQLQEDKKIFTITLDNEEAKPYTYLSVFRRRFIIHTTVNNAPLALCAG